MTITSNIDRVLGQVKTLHAEIPRAIRRAMNPDHWRERAREVAESVLRALASSEEMPHVAPFVDTISAGPLLNGMGFELHMQRPLPFRPFATQGALAGTGVAPTLRAELNEGQLDALLWEWVTQEKKKDERDAEFTDDEIVARLWNILFGPGSTPALERARAGLIPHISEFYQRKVGGLPAATADLWLRAVMAAWKAMISAEITIRIKAELHSKKFP